MSARFGRFGRRYVILKNSLTGRSIVSLWFTLGKREKDFHKISDTFPLSNNS